MKRILYYTVLRYTRDNLKYLTDSFYIEQIPDPRWDNTLAKENCEQIEAIFFPLGYKFEPIHVKRFPNLKVIVSNTTNTDHILTGNLISDPEIISLKGDTEFLENITPTAEHTWGLIHACHRNLMFVSEAINSGALWDRYHYGAPKMLSRMSLGIVGMGRIGKMVASIGDRTVRFIYTCDPKQGFEHGSLLEVASKSDVLTIHASNLPENKNMIDSKVFDAMPHGSIVINTAHGDLLNVGDLIDAIKSGQIRAAALDVLPGEYNPSFQKDDGTMLARCARLYPRLILTPHIGGSTEDAWHETQRRVIDKVIEVLK